MSSYSISTKTITIIKLPILKKETVLRFCLCGSDCTCSKNTYSLIKFILKQDEQRYTVNGYCLGNKCTKHQFIHLLTATFKDLHIENSKNYKRWYCPHHTNCVSMCCWILSPFV